MNPDDLDKEIQRRLYEQLSDEEGPIRPEQLEGIAERQPITFYQFWKWEYKRRNPEYLKKYYGLTSPSEKFGMCDPSCGMSSTEIIERIIEEDFEHIEPAPLYSFLHEDREGSEVDYKWVQIYDDKKNSKKISINISGNFDPKSKPDIVSNLIKKIFKIAKEEEKEVYNIYSKSYDGNGVEMYFDYINRVSKSEKIDFYQAKKRVDLKFPEWNRDYSKVCPKSLRDIDLLVPKRSTQSRDEIRAIGLWLYDYKNQ